MSLRGGDILLDLFKLHGVEYIFCSPGTEWVPVWENLAQNLNRGDKSINYINCRDETLAIAAAIGYGKSTGKLSVVLLHANVGVLHGAMAIRAALWAKAPVLILSAFTTDYDENNGKVTTESHWLSRLSDIGGPSALVKHYVKWCNTVTSRETMVDSIMRGCRAAVTAPYGPVFISIPRELIEQQMTDVKLPTSPTILSRTIPNTVDLEMVARRLVDSKHPIIITEYAGENTGSIARITELAELLSIPVYEYTGPVFANFPKNHPLHQGYDAGEALKKADTIVIIGAITPWYPPSAFPRDDAVVIALDEDSLNLRLPYHGYKINYFIAGDIEQSLNELIIAVGTQLQTSIFSASIFQERFKQYSLKHNEISQRWISEAISEKSKSPISPAWFYYLANKVMPENTISIIETLTHSRYAYRYLADAYGYFRTCGGGLGIGLGIAIGTKLACKDIPVVYYVGDGSFNYNPVLAGLGLCQEYNIPILTIILNNGSYAAMKTGYNKQGWSAINNSYLGVDILPRPEYTKVAEAFHTYTDKLTDPAHIEETLKSALSSIEAGRPALLDVIV
jgi:acetolactate synthase-1/2/3 large subunit